MPAKSLQITPDAAPGAPVSASAGVRFEAVIRWALLAPSIHNTQPWFYRLRGDALELCASEQHGLPTIDPQGRQLAMSCGAALFHIRLAMRHFGYLAKVELLPQRGDSLVMARVRFGDRRQPTDNEERLFDAIVSRHTHRAPFEDRPVPGALLRTLQHDVLEEGAWLWVASNPDARCGVADLIASGDRRQGAAGAFRRELAASMRSNEDRRRDGVPGYARSLGRLASIVAPFFIRTFDWGGRRARHDRDLALHAPALVVLGTGDETPRAWLYAGQALARLLLEAAAAGVSASFLNQPIEVAELRGVLAQRIGNGGYPQLVMRLGYGRPTRATPRRTFHEALVPY